MDHHQSRWSELPEDIIHRIFSFIATTREAARLCLLSKSWLHAWNSYLKGPSFVFIEKESSSAKKLNQFYKFVEHTVTKFKTEKPNTKIRKLVLESVIPCSSQIFSDNVRDNVSDMTLLITNKIHVLLRDSWWITSLNSGGCCCQYRRRTRPPDLDLSDLVNFPNLRSLTLPTTTVISTQTVETFLKRCPLLETLRCGAVYTPKKSRGTTLLGGSKLKYLDLEIAYFTAEPLNDFLSELGFLETLKISFEPCERHQVAMISNGSVRDIEMHIRGWVGEVIIDAPRLSCFRYTEDVLFSVNPERLLISVMNPTNIFRSHLTVSFYNDVKFLNDLANLMCLFGNLRTLSIHYRAEVLGDKSGKARPSSAGDRIEGFNLRIEASSFFASYEDVLDQVLQICHPLILTVTTSGNSEMMSGYEMLMNREEEFKCRCSDNVNYCWKHQLKDVQIDDDIKSNKLQSTYVRLKLKW